jgi:DnaJ-class molecular chaperone
MIHSQTLDDVKFEDVEHLFEEENAMPRDRILDDEEIKEEHKFFYPKHLYQILGLHPNATKHQIYNKFRRHIKAYHISNLKFGNKRFSEKRLLEICNSFEILGDDEWKKVYDARKLTD